MVTAAPAAAAPKPITGKLSQPGLSVIALATNGEARVEVVKQRRFKLRPPAERVSLHLRAADGTYAGPVVVGKDDHGTRAILGVHAGAGLGQIKVNTAKGYAKLAEPLAEEPRVSRLQARARNGVPIGAGVFGRVSTSKLTGPASDPDADGLPDPLDIDDDGDLILDNVDRSARSRATLAEEVDQFHAVSELALPIYDTVNANSAAFSDADLEAALPDLGRLVFEILPGAATELDCRGLLYCSAGGTGRKATNLNPPEGTPFPGSPGDPFDIDGDGFGRLTPGPGSVSGMYLLHGAHGRDPALDPAVSQIGTGDLLVEHVTAAGDESQCPQPTTTPDCGSFLSTVGFVFATGPALVSFSDETTQTTVPYPIAGPYSGPPEGFVPSGPGTLGNGFPVTDSPDDADQDVELTVTFWRPQRRPIEGEECPPPAGNPCTPNDWIDIGGLTYTPVAGFCASPPACQGFAACPQSTLSSGDSELTPADPAIGFIDGALDAPADPGSTVAFTVNASQCLASFGITSWDSGQELGLSLQARDDSLDVTEQGINFKRQ